MLVALGLCAAAMKLALALTTEGTNDTYVFWLAHHLNREFGPAWAYQHCPINYPPFLLHFVRALDALEQATGVIAFGMSCNVKIWPIVLTPVFFSYVKTWGTRVQFLLAAGATVFIASVPYLLAEPSLIVGRVLGYRSAPGCWGVTRVLSLHPSWALWNVAYVDAGRYVAVGAIVGAAVLMNRRAVRPPLFTQCGIAANLFMTLTPGFGVQYIAWLIPWLAWSRVWYALTFQVVSGAFLFFVYTFWSRGIPWSFADAAVGPWPPRAIAVELATWGLVVLYVLLAVKDEVNRMTSHLSFRSRIESRKRKAVASALSTLFI